jgi:hypothetical protein
MMLKVRVATTIDVVDSEEVAVDQEAAVAEGNVTIVAKGI